MGGTGKLRVFGSGKNKVCWTYVDNYCHGLILAERALYKDSPALGKFYVCTDGDTHPFSEGYCLMWDEIDKMAIGVGFPSIKEKMHLPKWLMLMVGYTCDVIGHILGRVLKLNAFAVHMMTMHRWFRITNAERDLGYKPIVGFNEGCADTVHWFKKKWLPSYDAATSGFLNSDVAKQTKRKIDIQAASADSTKTPLVTK